MTGQAKGSFKEFVQFRSGSLLHFAFWMTGNWEDAEDAVQESLAKAYLAWPRIEQPEAYLHRLVINTVRRGYRARRREILVADPPDAAPMRSAEAALEAFAARSVLVTALRRLPRNQRAVLVLRYCLDLPVADVAALMGCSAGTVKSQASRALAKLGADPALGTWHDSDVREGGWPA